MRQSTKETFFASDTAKAVIGEWQGRCLVATLFASHPNTDSATLVRRARRLSRPSLVSPCSEEMLPINIHRNNVSFVLCPIRANDSKRTCHYWRRISHYSNAKEWRSKRVQRCGADSAGLRLCLSAHDTLALTSVASACLALP